MTPSTRALLAALSPVALSSGNAFSWSAERENLYAGPASAVALCLAALLPGGAGRAVSLLGLLGIAVSHRAALLDSPMLALSAALFSTWLVLRIFDGPGGDTSGQSSARGASVGAGLLWLGYLLLKGFEGRAPWLLAASLGLAVALSFAAARRDPNGRSHVVEWSVCVAATLLLPLICLRIVPPDAIGPAALLLWWVRVRRESNLGVRRWAFILEHPERLLVLTFAGLCVIGTLVLSLPQSGVERLALIDAAFTAVSAVCVTGLTVVDTGAHFTLLGQWSLLLLIQIGGLGIMTLSTMGYAWMGRRMTLRQELAAEALLGHEGRGALLQVTQRILLFTFLAEACGGLLLTIAFAARGEPLSGAIFRGMFTAVSAFCNAGFALQSDSLMGYADSPLVLHTVAMLIVIGGLSPASVVAIPGLLRPHGRPRRLRYLLPLVMSLVLALIGMLAVLALEWQGTLRSLDWFERLNNAWFQSITLRTAGFNSIDFGAIGAPTITLCLVFMFIGGSPGGTAGGIKTTTFALTVLGVLRAVRGQDSIVVFRRQVSETSTRRASVIFTLGLFGALLGVIALQLTQTMPPEMAVFEAVSALGTVGLTIGGTARLDEVGKVVIMVCMFVGRVGGLTLLMFLSTRRAMGSMSRPEEDVETG